MSFDPIPTEDAIWTWLTHEQTFKGTLTPLVGAIGLGGVRPRLVGVAEIKNAVRALDLPDAQYLFAVRLTVDVMAKHHWETRIVDLGALRQIHVTVGRPPERPAMELRSAWRVHLAMHPEQARDDQVMLEKLARGEDLGRVMVYERGYQSLGDGRHRLLAILDHVESNNIQSYAQTILCGREV